MRLHVLVFLFLFLQFSTKGNADPAARAFSFRWLGQNALTRCGEAIIPDQAWPQPGSPGCYTTYLSSVRAFPYCRVESFSWTDGGIYEERSGCGAPTEEGFYINGRRGGFPLYQKKIWGPEYTYKQPSKSICDVTMDFEGGFLCAIKPSRLDPNARDTYYGGTHRSMEDRYKGFGYHALVFPKNGTKVKGVYVHFKGSYGRPYSPSTGEFPDIGTGRFPDVTFLKESASSGYLMIQLAYSNRYAINVEECAANRKLDNCAGRVREDKLTGLALSASDLTGTTIEDTPVADSAEYRLKKLKTYLEGKGFKFPVEFVVNDKVDWGALRVGGHSQGSGMAAYLAKNFGVSHACLLAGIHDTNDDVNNPEGLAHADWFMKERSLTSSEKQKAVLCEDDPAFAAFKVGLSLLGVSDKELSFPSGYRDEDGNPVDGHSAPILDPRFKRLREEACFGD